MASIASKFNVKTSNGEKCKNLKDLYGFQWGFKILGWNGLPQKGMDKLHSFAEKDKGELHLIFFVWIGIGWLWAENNYSTGFELCHWTIKLNCTFKCLHIVIIVTFTSGNIGVIFWKSNSRGVMAQPAILLASCLDLDFHPTSWDFNRHYTGIEHTLWGRNSQYSTTRLPAVSQRWNLWPRLIVWHLVSALHCILLCISRFGLVYRVFVIQCHWCSTYHNKNEV